MANQLQEGQRIDVYEALELITFSPIPKRTYVIGKGTQMLVKDNLSGDWVSLFMKDDKHFIFNMKDEVQKCGYYLKVKSLKSKGASND